MSKELLQTYIKALRSLNRASIKGIKAPHKPILLISIIQSIAVGEIKENKIEITPLLVARFKDNWNALVREDLFKPNFALPFYHLSSEKFWHLKTYISKEILLTSSLSIRSFSQLREAVAYAYLDQPLYDILNQTESRTVILHFLLEKYFDTAGVINEGSDVVEIVTDQILHDSPDNYQHIIERADEEEIFIRCGVFKKLVPQIYDYTCCISGMRIISGYDIQMVDACHIVPFALSHNDTISNGISLSPNLHRAFDRGLLMVDTDFRVIVSDSFTEASSDTSIKVYNGKRILLPKENEYYPSLENLEWHRKNVFK